MDDLGLEFEVDFVTYLNMSLGMSYENARKQALEDLRESSDQYWKKDEQIL